MSNALSLINQHSGLIQIALIVVVLPFLRTYLRKRTEQGANTDLLGALTRGTEFALSALQTSGGRPITKAALTALALEYAKRSHPEALATLRPSKEQLERVAQAQAEPVIRAAVTAAAAAGAPSPIILPGTPEEAAKRPDGAATAAAVHRAFSQPARTN